MGTRVRWASDPTSSGSRVDFYPTPAAAVLPLIPHLRGVRTFAEPCAGNGDLVRHLEVHGLRCVYQGDIAVGQDAIALDQYGAIDAIITNPPWTRKLLHPLIEHFQRIASTWLLLDQDWAGTKQAVPYLTSCSDILPVGRQICDSGDHHARQGQCGVVPFRRPPRGWADLPSVSLGAVGTSTDGPVQPMRQVAPAAAIQFLLLLQCLPPARVP